MANPPRTRAALIPGHPAIMCFAPEFGNIARRGPG
tara:strand:- start:79976 stop:80080 length:105 start_codon:yes stop_codon:yes gene_type:complete